LGHARRSLRAAAGNTELVSHHERFELQLHETLNIELLSIDGRKVSHKKVTIMWSLYGSTGFERGTWSPNHSVPIYPNPVAPRSNANNPICIDAHKSESAPTSELIKVKPDPQAKPRVCFKTESVVEPNHGASATFEPVGPQYEPERPVETECVMLERVRVKRETVTAVQSVRNMGEAEESLHSEPRVLDKNESVSNKRGRVIKNYSSVSYLNESLFKCFLQE
jgi:hypothetical protein